MLKMGIHEVYGVFICLFNSVLKIERNFEKVKAFSKACVLSVPKFWLFCYFYWEKLAKMLNQYSLRQGKEMRFPVQCHERRDLLQWKIDKYQVTKMSSTLQAYHIVNKNNHPQQVMTLCESLEGFLLIVFH